MGMIQHVYLTKYTPKARLLIFLGQELADKRRDEKYTVSHLCKVVNAFIDSDQTLAKMNLGKPYINPKLAEKFMELYDEQKEEKLLSGLRKADKPNNSYISVALLRIMSFAEDQQEVNINILMTELLLVLRDKKSTQR